MEYTIRALRVRFPFKAYECQLLFMERVIQALQEGTNALLESPTGTGKTLCLLCAALAWREAEQARILQLDEGSSRAPRIFYLSRTHSQLTKVISELRGSGYAPTSALLGARSQLCINPAVKSQRGPRLNTACHSLVARRGCAYYEGVAAKKEDPALTNAILDIEELSAAGEQHKCCPYYLSRELQTTADIVFMPYNYVLEASARRTSKVELSGAILIFDEAHNLESFCEDATSCTITTADIRDALRDITPLLPKLARLPQETSDRGRVATEYQSPASPTDELPVDVTSADFAAACSALAAVLRAVEAAIDRAPLGVAQSGRALYTMFAGAGLTFVNAARHVSCLDALSSLLQDPPPSERQGAAARALVPQQPRAGAAAVGRLSEALKTAYVDGMDEPSAIARADYFKMHVHIAPSPRSSVNGAQDSREREVGFWCVSAGVAMQELRRLGVRNILLASGTLSPLTHTAYEFQTPFPVRLENPHIVAPQQLWVGAMARGVSNIALNSSYKNRDSAAYKRELGATIVNFCRMVPAGLLVFFPSYTLLTACVAFWKSPESSGGGATTAATVWDRVCKYKHAVVEPRESAQFAAALLEYRTRLTDPTRQGAVFFAVCRGKVAEGLDFADDMGRAVIVTGLPYPAVGDDKVKVKRAYLDEKAAHGNPTAGGGAHAHTLSLASPAGEKAITGNEWYAAQAWRAVNQAVGRVIRHRWDYAAIVLLDERFCSDERSNFLSKWLQPYLRLHGQFAEASLSLARFFKEGPNKVLEAKAKAAGELFAVDPMVLAPPAIPLLLPPPAAPQLSAAQQQEQLASIDFGTAQNGQPGAFTGFAFGSRASAPPRNPTSQLPGLNQQGQLVVPPAAPAPVLTEEQRRAAELTARVAAYKKEVKGVLSAAAFGEFQKGLRQYKLHQIQVPELMAMLKPAFATAGAEKYEVLMRGFVLFLPKKDRLIYESEMEGTFAPAAAGMRKREDESGNKRRTFDLITGEATIGSNKTPRLERVASLEMKSLPAAASLSSASVSVSTSAHPPSHMVVLSPLPPPIHSHTSSRAPHSPAALPLPPAFVPPRPLTSSPRHATSPIVETISTTPPHNNAAPNSNAHVFSTPPPLNITVRPTTPMEQPPDIVATAHPTLAAADSSPPKNALPPEAESPKEKELPRTSGKCPVCLDPPTEPCAARCGHVLCFACWEKQLSHKLECPVCKQKVRKSQVKRIYLG